MVNARMMLLLVALLAVIGCASPRRTFTVWVSPSAASQADVRAAADMWEAAVPGISITIVDDDSADLVITLGDEVVDHDLNENICANTYASGRIVVNAEMSDYCAQRMPLVLAHEFGHYMANRTDHIGPGHIMTAQADAMGEEITAEDVEYIGHE